MVANVPDVGNVTDVAPVNVPVRSNAPEVVKFPPSVIVLPVLSTPVPPRVPDNVPVHPTVIDVARSNAVMGVPPSVSVTLASSVFVNAAPVISNPLIVDHDGTADTTPVPVWDKYCFTAVVFPDNFDKVFNAEE